MSTCTNHRGKKSLFYKHFSAIHLSTMSNPLKKLVKLLIVKYLYQLLKPDF